MQEDNHAKNVFIALCFSVVADALLVYDDDVRLFLAGELEKIWNNQLKCLLEYYAKNIIYHARSVSISLANSFAHNCAYF